MQRQAKGQLETLSLRGGESCTPVTGWLRAAADLVKRVDTELQDIFVSSSADHLSKLHNSVDRLLSSIRPVHQAFKLLRFVPSDIVVRSAD